MTIHRWHKIRERKFPCWRAEDPRVLERPVIGNQTSETGVLSRIAQLQLENARLTKLVIDLLLEKMEDGQAQLGIEGRKRKCAKQIRQ